jgi:hypothetical protein
MSTRAAPEATDCRWCSVGLLECDRDPPHEVEALPGPAGRARDGGVGDDQARAAVAQRRPRCRAGLRAAPPREAKRSVRDRSRLLRQRDAARLRERSPRSRHRRRSQEPARTASPLLVTRRAAGRDRRPWSWLCRARRLRGRYWARAPRRPPWPDRAQYQASSDAARCQGPRRPLRRRSVRRRRGSSPRVVDCVLDGDLHMKSFCSCYVCDDVHGPAPVQLPQGRLHRPRGWRGLCHSYLPATMYREGTTLGWFR